LPSRREVGRLASEEVRPGAASGRGAVEVAYAWARSGRAGATRYTKRSTPARRHVTRCARCCSGNVASCRRV